MRGAFPEVENALVEQGDHLAQKGCAEAQLFQQEHSTVHSEIVFGSQPQSDRFVDQVLEKVLDGLVGQFDVPCEWGAQHAVRPP